MCFFLKTKDETYSKRQSGIPILQVSVVIFILKIAIDSNFAHEGAGNAMNAAHLVTLSSLKSFHQNRLLLSVRLGTEVFHLPIGQYKYLERPLASTWILSPIQIYFRVYFDIIYEVVSTAFHIINYL